MNVQVPDSVFPIQSVDVKAENSIIAPVSAVVAIADVLDPVSPTNIELPPVAAMVNAFEVCLCTVNLVPGTGVGSVKVPATVTL